MLTTDREQYVGAAPASSELGRASARDLDAKASWLRSSDVKVRSTFARIVGRLVQRSPAASRSLPIALNRILVIAAHPAREHPRISRACRDAADADGPVARTPWTVCADRQGGWSEPPEVNELAACVKATRRQGLGTPLPTDVPD